MEDAEPPSPGLDLSEVGTVVDSIPVSVGYRIIDLFSGHLYSNPAKAIEELVVNAYDAFAQDCIVTVPEDWNSPGAFVTVWDNGEAMDKEGLKELWLVADTKKRLPQRERAAEKRGRLPIGKFGIGKLACYVLGRRITHVCKKNGTFLAVTMDFSKIVPAESEASSIGAQIGEQRVNLPVRKLTEEEARSLLPSDNYLPLFGPSAPDSWTIVIVDQLKDRARLITKGRLKWIIATALPAVPDFKVYLNGYEVEPSKLRTKVLKRWQIGKNDKRAADKNYESGADTNREPPFDTWVVVPGIGPVSGTFVLTQDSLVGGKSAEVGRSHGFFIMVRRRLVNHEDEMFGIQPLSHATLNRLRAVVYADGLDKSLVASREGVSEEQRSELAAYLNAKFYEIRDWYEDFLERRSKEEALETRIAGVPGPLARFPLMHAVERASRLRWVGSRAIRPPRQGQAPVHEIRGFERATLDSFEPVAIFDGATGLVRINVNHPYYVNFSESPDIEAFCAAEVLLEAYLHDVGLSANDLRSVLTKRDDLLRALVRQRPLSVEVVAEQLRDSVHSEKDLEEACHAAFRSLGFEVTPLSGKNRPDGLATAVLGVRYAPGRRNVILRSYTVSYDAKSTGKARVKSSNLGMATIDRHRDKFRAQHAVVIAPDYETTEGKKSKAVTEAKKLNVTLIRALDLATLVETSGTKPLPLDHLRSLFEKCRSPDQCRQWVERYRRAKESTPNIRAMLDTVFALQMGTPQDPASLGAIRLSNPKLKSLSERQIEEWLDAIAKLVPEYVRVYGGKVELNQHPNVVAREIQRRLRRIEARGDGARRAKPAGRSKA